MSFAQNNHEDTLQALGTCLPTKVVPLTIWVYLMQYRFSPMGAVIGVYNASTGSLFLHRLYTSIAASTLGLVLV